MIPTTPQTPRRWRLWPIALLLACLAPAVQAQEPWCGSKPTPEQLAQMIATRDARQNFDVSMMRGTIRWVPITWHLFRSSAGTGGASLSQVQERMATLNTIFSPANIQFYMCGAPRQVADDVYYLDLTLTEAKTYGATNDVAGTMNVYVPSSVSGSSSAYAYFPGGPERVVVGANILQNAKFIHEVGHFFGLYHTHADDVTYEGYNVNYVHINELPDGSNCSFAGDLICDTPADPGLAAANVVNCVYTGNPTFAPLVNNFMSYAPSACLTSFTPGQYNVMAYAAVYERANLNCSNAPVPCATPVTTFPHNMSFEGGSQGDWGQSALDDFDWSLSNVATPTANTGPDAAQSGSYFAYLEATGNNPLRTAELYSPCFDLNYTQSPELTFWYHMNGTHTGSLKVQISTDAGSNWLTVFGKSGNQGNTWQQATVDLKTYVENTFFRIRFVGATGTGGDLSDIGIDNIDLHSKLCAGTTASISHNNLSCMHASTGSATTTVSGTGGPWTYAWNTGATSTALTNLPSGAYEVTVTNAAGCKTTMGTFVEESLFRLTPTGFSSPTFEEGNDGTISIQLTGGVPPYTVVATEFEDYFVTVTMPGVTGPNYTFTGLLPGNWRLEATDAIGCKQGVPNVRVPSYRCAMDHPLLNVSATETFESGAGIFDPACYGNINQFLVASGATPQANTGPDAAFEGNNYIYYDAANAVAATSLESPRLNLSTVTRASLRFRYHKYGANCGYLRVFKWGVNDPENPVVLFNAAPGDEGNQWKTASLDLTSMCGSNSQYFLFYFGLPVGGTAGEVALDAVEILDCSSTLITRSQQNVGCVANSGSCGVTVTGPGAPYSYLWSTGSTSASLSGLAAGTYTLTITGTNGCFLIETFTVTTTGPILATRVTHESVPGANDGAIDLSITDGYGPFTYLWSNAATTQDLTNLAPGTYTVTVTDSRSCTTTEVATVTGATCADFVAGFPYTESFEGTTLADWSNVTGDNFDWTGPFTGATPTAGSGPDAAASGTKYLYTEADPSNYPSKTAWLQSKCFDFSGASAVTFTFKYHLYSTKASNMGSLSLVASTDNGATWSANLWTVSGNLGNLWNTATVSLNAYAGKNTRLRFVAVTGDGSRADRGLDLFQITTTPAKVGNTALPEGSGLGHLNVFPNPAADETTVSFSSETEQVVHLRVSSVAGLVVQQMEVPVTAGSTEVKLNTTDLASGLYFVEVAGENGKAVKRLVIEN